MTHQYHSKSCDNTYTRNEMITDNFAALGGDMVTTRENLLRDLLLYERFSNIVKFQWEQCSAPACASKARGLNACVHADSW